MTTKSFTNLEVATALADGAIEKDVLCRLSSKYPGHTDDVQTAVQEASLSAHDNDTFHDRTHLTHWIWRRAEMDVKDAIKKAQRRGHLNVTIKPAEGESSENAFDRALYHQHTRALNEERPLSVATFRLPDWKTPLRLDYEEVKTYLVDLVPDATIRKSMFKHLAFGTTYEECFAQLPSGQVFGTRSTTEASFKNLMKEAKVTVMAKIREDYSAPSKESSRLRPTERDFVRRHSFGGQPAYSYSEWGQSPTFILGMAGVRESMRTVGKRVLEERRREAQRCAREQRKAA